MCVYSLTCTIGNAELKNITMTSGTKTYVIKCKNIKTKKNPKTGF